jgi:outer membrane protein OmpA-like peptidoglycan-associated protein
LIKIGLVTHGILFLRLLSYSAGAKNNPGTIGVKVMKAAVLVLAVALAGCAPVYQSLIPPFGHLPAGEPQPEPQPAPAPAAAPMPAPVAPAQPQAQQGTENFVLYFSVGTTLTSESRPLIAKIVQAAKSRPAPKVVIIGHTDTLDSTAFNDKLGQRRADSIAAELRRAGVPAQAITTESRGERELQVKTPDNTFEPKNRRVEVTVR